jgi:hypothetical protein
MKLSPSDSVHGLVHQVGQGNLAALRPCVPGPGGHNQRIVEQHTLLRIIVSTTLGHTGDDQVDAAVVEFAIKNDSVGLRDVKYDAWILLQQRLEDRRQEIGRQRRRCPDAQLAKGGIGQKIDQLKSLSQIVEKSEAALIQGATVHCGLDAASVAVDQVHAEGVLKIGDRFRNRRLRHSEGHGRLAHTPGLDDGRQDIEIAQLETALDAMIQGHGVVIPNHDGMISY